jgi:hypothetical protein
MAVVRLGSGHNPWDDLLRIRTALQYADANLTRRRSTDSREECWHVHYGDMHAGTISNRTGNPHDTDPWQWHCGFYPGSHPGEHTNGTAPTFEQARSDFEQAWAVVSIEANRRRFSGMARPTGLDRGKISAL